MVFDVDYWNRLLLTVNVFFAYMAKVLKKTL